MGENRRHKRLSWRRFGVFALGLLMIGSLIFGLFGGTMKRRMCQSSLRVLSFVIVHYPSESFRGEFPSSLVTLLDEGFISDTRDLMCPGVHHDKKDIHYKGDIPNGEGWSDYTYINWSNYYDNPGKVPPRFPLMYDRALSNHSGRGINIARVDGSVFWDSDGTWLRNFAANHPEYDIPVPK